LSISQSRRQTTTLAAAAAALAAEDANRLQIEQLEKTLATFRLQVEEEISKYDNNIVIDSSKLNGKDDDFLDVELFLESPEQHYWRSPEEEAEFMYNLAN